MNTNQLNAVLKAFAWQGWKSSTYTDASYSHFKTINAGKIYAFLAVSKTYNHPIYLQFICEGTLEGDAVLIPTEASAAETFLMTTKALIQAIEKLEDFVRVV